MYLSSKIMILLALNFSLFQGFLVGAANNKTTCRERIPKILQTDPIYLQDLIAKAKTGDSTAMNQLIKIVNASIRDVISNRAHKDDIGDVSQITLLEVFKDLGSYDPNLSFDAWAKSIAKNRAIDSFRRRRRNQRVFDEQKVLEATGRDFGEHPQVGNVPEKVALEFFEGVRTFLLEYLANDNNFHFSESIAPKIHKEILFGYLHGEKNQKIAERLNLTPQEVGNQLFKMRKAIQSLAIKRELVPKSYENSKFNLRGIFR
mgnify:CR=1 FL=1